MKKIFVSAIFVYSSLFTIAQKEANIWQFGRGAGLDFNQNPVVATSNAGVAFSFEGMSSVADKNGKLIFYTDGINVVNKQHVLMNNGTQLHGNRSSTNNTVIVPSPAKNEIYYIFTTGSALDEDHSFKYSVVDMNANAGLGDVISKNNLLEDIVFEKVAAIKHCNQRDVWVVVHKWATDKYYTYLVTAAGVNPVPVVSSTGLIISGNENNEMGTLKFSVKGNKLASLHSFENDNVELMDFDNTTGVISNPIIFKPNVAGLRHSSFPGVYGAEFSPDGKLLYVTANNSEVDASVLYQFDISSNDPVAIMATKNIISINTPLYAGALQMGPNQKIYMAMWKDNHLSVIENPDVYGTGCNFKFQGIPINSRNNEPVQFGLPTFIQSSFDTANIPYDFTRTGSCLNTTINFKINRTSGIDSVKWDFGDGQFSQAFQPSNNYAAPGFYDVKLIVYKVDCSALFDTIVRRIWIADQQYFLRTDTTSCIAFGTEIGVDEIFGVNYLWNTGYTGNKITTTGFGTYWLELEQNGCKIRDSVYFTEKPRPIVNLGPDTSVCLYKPVILKGSSNTAATFLWSTGETTQTISVNKKGTYYVTVSEGLCVSADTVLVIPGDCDIYVPSAFTPNNDNLNETFGVITEVTVQSFSLQLFSKWGQMIFNATDVSQKWDGTFKGKDMPNGAYFWMMNYVNKKGKKIYDQGIVLLIR